MHICAHVHAYRHINMLSHTRTHTHTTHTHTHHTHVHAHRHKWTTIITLLKFLWTKFHEVFSVKMCKHKYFANTLSGSCKNSMLKVYAKICPSDYTVIHPSLKRSGPVVDLHCIYTVGQVSLTSTCTYVRTYVCIQYLFFILVLLLTLLLRFLVSILSIPFTSTFMFSLSVDNYDVTVTMMM